MKEETRIIEVNGVKLEVDLRSAKRIDQFKVGDTVKVLVKEYNDYKAYIGVIVGFDNFKKRPTIVIAYLKADYSGAEIKFLHYHKDSEDVEITGVHQWSVPYSKQSVVDKMDKEIAKKQEELREIESKREYFLNMFGEYFDGKLPGDEL